MIRLMVQWGVAARNAAGGLHLDPPYDSSPALDRVSRDGLPRGGGSEAAALKKIHW